MPAIVPHAAFLTDGSHVTVLTRIASWWNNAPLLTKAVLIAIVPIIVAIGAPLAGTMLSRTIDDADAKVHVAQERQLAALTLETLHNDVITHAGALIVGGDSPEALAQFAQDLNAIEAARDGLLHGPAHSEEAALATRVLTASEDSVNYIASSIGSSTPVSMESILALNERNGALTAAVNDFLGWERARMEQQNTRREEAATWRTRTSWGGALVGGGVGVGALAVGLGTVLRRLQFLRRNAELLERGEDLLPASPARDEIGQLEVALQTASTRLRERERALRFSEQRFRLAFQDAIVGVALASADGKFTEVNAAFAALLGYTPGELRNMSVTDVLPLEDREAERERLAQARSGGTIRHIEEKRYLRRNGASVWGMTHATIMQGDEGGQREYLIMVQDVSERRALEDELRQRALHDSLTGLPNRSHLQERLQQVLEVVNSSLTPAALVFMDLDGFKQVNDQYGHAVGDLTLQAVANRIRASLRPGDIAARLGGDEFVLLIQDVTDPAEVGAVVERVLRSIDAPIPADGCDVHVHSSAGIVLLRPDPTGGNSDDLQRRAGLLLQEADAALYQAKALGGHRYVYAADTSLPAEQTPPPR